MPDNFQGFIGNLNELVQDYFSTTQLSYDPVAFASYPDKYSYIYSSLIKTKGPDIIKLSNLQNYLSEWDRPYSYGGFLRAITVGPVKPIDPPTFAHGSTPNNGQIRKADVMATYHPFKCRIQFMVTRFANQLKEAMSVPEEVGLFLAYVLQALNDGANDTLYRLYKEIIHKFWDELTAQQKTDLTVTLPATIATKEDAIQTINMIRDQKTNMMFGKGIYNAMGFPHTVTPDRQRLYIIHTLANDLVDYLKLDHYMGDVNYSDVPGSLSSFLGIPVKMLDDFGGQIPYSAENAQLYPIFDADGAVTGTYAATPGGTTSVDVDHWGTPTDYVHKALITEDDFGQVFPVNDNLLTDTFLLGGGYTNTARYIERMFLANPNSNTIFFK